MCDFNHFWCCSKRMLLLPKGRNSVFTYSEARVSKFGALQLFPIFPSFLFFFLFFAYGGSQAGGPISYSCWPMPAPRQRWILNPRSEARDRTRNIMVPSWICFRCAMTGTSSRFFLLWILNVFNCASIYKHTNDLKCIFHDCFPIMKRPV